MLFAIELIAANRYLSKTMQLLPDTFTVFDFVVGVVFPLVAAMWLIFQHKTRAQNRVDDQQSQDHADTNAMMREISMHRERLEKLEALEEGRVLYERDRDAIHRFMGADGRGDSLLKKLSKFEQDCAPEGLGRNNAALWAPNTLGQAVGGLLPIMSDQYIPAVFKSELEPTPRKLWTYVDELRQAARQYSEDDPEHFEQKYQEYEPLYSEMIEHIANVRRLVGL